MVNIALILSFSLSKFYFVTETRNTVGNVYAVVRHYCGRDLEDQPVTPFGGRVFVVKSDKSQFRHKSKVRVLLSMNTEIHPQ